MVAKWLGNGLQTRLSEFDSHPPLKIIYKKCLTLSKFIGSFRCKKKEIKRDMDEFFVEMDKAIGKKPKPIKLVSKSGMGVISHLGMPSKGVK